MSNLVNNVVSEDTFPNNNERIIENIVSLAVYEKVYNLVPELQGSWQFSPICFADLKQRVVDNKAIYGIGILYFDENVKAMHNTTQCKDNNKIKTVKFNVYKGLLNYL